MHRTQILSSRETKQKTTMSIQTVSESVKDDVGASGATEATRNSDDITSLAAWRSFWWNHSNKVINAGLKF